MVRLPSRRATRPQRLLGLDLGSHSVKLAELERTPSGVRLVKVLLQDVPRSTSGELVDQVGWLQTALKEFSTSEVHVALGGPEVALRRVSMPLMSLRELRDALQWQLKDLVSFATGDAVVDFAVLGEVWEKDIKKQDLLVAAAAKLAVQDVLTLVERAGGRVLSLAPMPQALWSCATALLPDAAQGSQALIELGARTTHGIIANNGHVRVVRDIPLGSASLTESLIGVVASERGDVTIDAARAEALKRQYGVIGEAPDGATAEGIPLFHIGSLMRPVLENLLVEVSRFLDFYKVQMEETGVSRVWLCGGGANLKALQPFLAEGLGVPVELLNPLQRLPDRVQSLEPEQIAEGGPRLVAALGAALAQGQALSLLPVERRRVRAPATAQPAAIQQWLARIAAGGAALALAMLLLWGAVEWQFHRQRRAWTSAESTYAQALSMVEETQRVAAASRQMEQFADAQPVWDGLLKELASVMPGSMQLETLAIEAPAPGARVMRLRLGGEALMSGDSSEGPVAEFLRALEESSFVRDVELMSSESRTGPERSTSFEIEGVIE